MELKETGVSLMHALIVCSNSNPFNGIEREIVFEPSVAGSKANPFNGIERAVIHTR